MLIPDEPGAQRALAHGHDVAAARGKGMRTDSFRSCRLVVEAVNHQSKGVVTPGTGSGLEQSSKETVAGQVTVAGVGVG